MLTLKDIRKDYAAGDMTVHALRGVSISFRENEFVSILGPSGCGKTTLLNIIGGLDQYTEGDLVINGRSTKEYKDRDWDTYRNHTIGFVFQTYNLIPHQSVLANVELALTISGVDKAERRERAVRVLERVGLGDQINKKPNQMSGGQMQRVAIARALINVPDILLAAGPTGALLAGSMPIVKRLRGDKRPAIGTVIPGTEKPYLLIDSGANVECRPEMLDAFAVMGSVYAEKVLGRKAPTVGLVNNGTEETKGTPDYVAAHALLKKNPAIHFVGNVEPKTIPTGHVDVIVCDGFVGNVVLKMTEGVAKSLIGELKGVFLASLRTKIAYLLVKDGLASFKKKLDADEHGGALMVGVAKPVIKAHGSSNAKAFGNAIRQAKLCVENGVVDAMQQKLAAMEDGKEA